MEGDGFGFCGAQSKRELGAGWNEQKTDANQEQQGAGENSEPENGSVFGAICSF